MTPDDATKAKAKEAFLDAVRAFVDEAHQLIANDLGERALMHILAVHLTHRFKGFDEGYDVDCEYNRNYEAAKGFPKEVLKRLLDTATNDFAKLDVEDIVRGERKVKHVFPDIIVHKRLSNEFNLIVVEAKKDGGDPAWDNLKLEAFRQRPFEYAIAISLTLHKPPRAVVRFLDDGEVNDVGPSQQSETTD